MNIDVNGKYCAYLRKSRADIEAEAKGQCETLTRHKNILKELAKKLNINIDLMYKEIMSGDSIASRPKMQQLLTDVENGKWDGVLVVEVERLARGNTIDQGIVAQTFQLSNTKIITPLKIYDPNDEFDEEYFEFGLFMSRREYKTINRRLQSGRLSSVKEGKFVGNITPYGYNKVKIENEKGFKLTPNDKEAKIVKLIFQLYTTGDLQENGEYKKLGARLIAKKLDNMNIPPRKNKYWSVYTIYDILKNPVYIGKIRWNYRKNVKKIVNGQITISRPKSSNTQYLLVDGMQEPLIDVDTFNLAQKIMSDKSISPINSSCTIKNPLSSIIVCGKCGRKMVRKPYNLKDKKDSLLCNNPHCNNISAPLHCVEDKIIEALNEWLNNYKLKFDYKEQKTDISNYINVQKNSIKNIDKEITLLKTQINRVHDLLEQGVYTTDTFLTRLKEHNDKLIQLENDKNNLQTNINKQIKIKKSVKEVIPSTQNLISIYHSINSQKTKNDILKEMVEKIVYFKNKNGRWYNSPDDFEITIYPKLPKNTSF